MGTYRFIVEEDGTVVPIGVDMGPGGVTLWRIGRKQVVWKWAGATSWSGRGQRSYHPTSFVVGDVVDIKRYDGPTGPGMPPSTGIMVTFDWTYDFPAQNPVPHAWDALVKLADAPNVVMNLPAMTDPVIEETV